MKPFISIDIETTGLNPECCDVLEIGAVFVDWETPIVQLPTFQCYIRHEKLYGEPYALSMHPQILRRIATEEEPYDYVNIGRVASVFRTWLREQGLNPDKQHLQVAGKNFAAFDLQFLKKIPQWTELVPIQHRIIDPGNLYWDPAQDTKGLPNLATCKKRADLPEEVAHSAVADAIDVARLVREWYKDTYLDEGLRD